MTLVCPPIWFSVPVLIVVLATSPTSTTEGKLRSSEGVERKYGFNMSLLGMVANGVGGTLVFVVVIILSQTLSGEAAQSS